MRKFVIASALITGVATAFLLSGCGAGSGLHEVSGTITYDNSPVTEGVVEFWPLDGQGTKGSTNIANGSYKIPKANGLQVGKYRVSIICGDGFSGAGDAGQTPTKAKAQSGGGTPGQERSPPEYYGPTSKQIAEVTNGGVNKFDYSVPKRKS
jgi:hypothetical protein